MESPASSVHTDDSPRAPLEARADAGPRGTGLVAPEEAEIGTPGMESGVGAHAAQGLLGAQVSRAFIEDLQTRCQVAFARECRELEEFKARATG
jgi:hypothetical protein